MFKLQKSLPLLRQSLVTKELVIEGIKPPSHNIAFAGTISANIPVILTINFAVEHNNNIGILNGLGPSTSSRSDARLNGSPDGGTDAGTSDRPDDHHAAHGTRSDTGAQPAAPATPHD